MEARTETREFLVSRRARITPEQAGLTAYGSNRRVKGLRGDEVAMLAGISAEYHVRLERGTVRGVSEDVLDGIARALQLDEADLMHLFDLARAANASPARRSSRGGSPERVRPVVQRILDSLVSVPAFVQSACLDVLAADQLGEAFHAPHFEDLVRPVNGARFVFLNPRAKEFFVEWDTIANDCVGMLRTEAGRDPVPQEALRPHRRAVDPQRGVPAAVGGASRELHRTGVKRFRHTVVGDLTRLRGAGPARRPRPAHARVLRRARIAVGRGAAAAGELGVDPTRRANGAQDLMDLEPKRPIVKGPTDWFTGDVWMDTLPPSGDHSTLNVAAVHFTPGARTARHAHEGGRTLYVTEGEAGPSRGASSPSPTTSTALRSRRDESDVRHR